MMLNEDMYMCSVFLDSASFFPSKSWISTVIIKQTFDKLISSFQNKAALAQPRWPSPVQIKKSIVFLLQAHFKIYFK